MALPCGFATLYPPRAIGPGDRAQVSCRIERDDGPSAGHPRILPYTVQRGAAATRRNVSGDVLQGL